VKFWCFHPYAGGLTLPCFKFTDTTWKKSNITLHKKKQYTTETQKPNTDKKKIRDTTMLVLLQAAVIFLMQMWRCVYSFTATRIYENNKFSLT